MWSDWSVLCDVVSLSDLWLRRIRGLWKLPDGRDWLRGKLSLVLMGRAMFSKSVIQFSMDGQGCYLTSGQTMVVIMKIMATSFKRSHAHMPHTVPPTLQQATPTQASAGESWTLVGKSGSVSCGVTAPIAWVLVCTRFSSWSEPQ